MLVYGQKVAKDNPLIELKEQELIAKMKELEGLNSEDKKLAHKMLDLIIAKKQLNELVKHIHKAK